MRIIGTDATFVREPAVGDSSGSDAVAAVGAYLRAVQVPWALRAFPVGADADGVEIAEHLDEMAVLRLDQV